MRNYESSVKEIIRQVSDVDIKDTAKILSIIYNKKRSLIEEDLIEGKFSQ
jgi:hypothetical protein